MTLYEKIKQMSFEDMKTFILHQIHSDCHGCYDEECEEEGYITCDDCIGKMLMREVK